MPLGRRLPTHPLAMARFGAVGLPPMSRLVRRFETDEARGLLAGVGAHAVRPLTAPFTSAFGLVLAVAAHTSGWPLVQGGSARLVEALLAELAAGGGTVTTGRWVTDLGELPRCDATVLDTSPRTLASLAKDRLPARYRAALGRFPYGPGLCKVDWALSGAGAMGRGGLPPSRHRARRRHLRGGGGRRGGRRGRAPRRAPVLHRRPTLRRRPLARAVRPPHPVGLLPRPERLDPRRHRRDRVADRAVRAGVPRPRLARTTTTAAASEAANPNYVGGDISGGPSTLRATSSRARRCAGTPTGRR